MKNKMLLTCFLTVGMTLFLDGMTPLFAQNPATGGPQPAAGPDPTSTPIDGGVSLLLAAGVGLGLKRLRRRPQPAPNLQ